MQKTDKRIYNAGGGGGELGLQHLNSLVKNRLSLQDEKYKNM